jgi:hypothetical protein
MAAGICFFLMQPNATLPKTDLRPRNWVVVSQIGAELAYLMLNMEANGG